MPKVLITGIGGFVGKHLALLFLEKGWEVYGFDRRGTTLLGVVVTQIDLLDTTALGDFVARVQPDYIVHLAAQSSVQRSWSHPEETTTINVQGTLNLLEAVVAAGIGKQCQVLIVSSAEIYGIPEKLPLTEDSPLRPVNPYGQSRLAQEQAIHSFQQKHQLHCVVARSFPHTGPGQEAQFVCSSFAQQVAAIDLGLQKPEVSVGNISVSRDFLNVRDVVQAYYLLLEQKKQGIYNICSGKAISLSEVLETLCLFSSKKIAIVEDAAKIRPVEVPILQGDNSKLCRDTGWVPHYTLTETMRELYGYWKEQLRVKA